MWLQDCRRVLRNPEMESFICIGCLSVFLAVSPLGGEPFVFWGDLLFKIVKKIKKIIIIIIITIIIFYFFFIFCQFRVFEFHIPYSIFRIPNSVIPAFPTYQEKNWEWN